jgi:hypothetical protein
MSWVWRTVDQPNESGIARKGRGDEMTTSHIVLRCVGIGLFLLGVVSLVSLEATGPRRWQKAIASWGVGASFGGVITIIILGDGKGSIATSPSWC